MATLQNIRNKSGLLLAVIGIAMLAFILGDLLKSTNSGSGNSINVGEVLGDNILIQKFQNKVDEGIDNWKIQNEGAILNQSIIAQIRDQIWNQYIKDLVMENEFEELGIDVSDDEFFELLQGMNVHPEISKVSSFQNPETGQFDRTRVLGYLKQIDQDQSGDARDRWLGFQEYLIGLIKNSKYNLTNKEVLILGAGGVVPSIIFALNKMKISKIKISNRTKDKAENLKTLFKNIEIIEWGEVTNVDMIINATSLGLKKEDKINLDFSLISKNRFFYDVIYNPRETNFLKTGESLGCKTLNGKLMFIYKALLAFNIWHKLEPNVDENVIKLLD